MRPSPDGVPEVPPFPRTIRALSWARPDTWVRAGRRLRDVDAIVVVHVMPAVVPAHLALLRAAGAVPGGRRSAPAVDRRLPQRPAARAAPGRRPPHVGALLARRLRARAQRRPGHAWPTSWGPDESRSPTSRPTCPGATRSHRGPRPGPDPPARPRSDPRVQGHRRAPARHADRARGDPDDRRRDLGPEPRRHQPPRLGPVARRAGRDPRRLRPRRRARLAPRRPRRARAALPLGDGLAERHPRPRPRAARPRLRHRPLLPAGGRRRQRDPRPAGGRAGARGCPASSRRPRGPPPPRRGRADPGPVGTVGALPRNARGAVRRRERAARRPGPPRRRARTCPLDDPGDARRSRRPRSHGPRTGRRSRACSRTPAASWVAGLAVVAGRRPSHRDAGPSQAGVRSSRLRPDDLPELGARDRRAG